RRTGPYDTAGAESCQPPRFGGAKKVFRVRVDTPQDALRMLMFVPTRCEWTAICKPVSLTPVFPWSNGSIVPDSSRRIGPDRHRFGFVVFGGRRMTGRARRAHSSVG